MTTADQLKALLASHLVGDDERFRATALEIVAQSARDGHTQFAEELRTLLRLEPPRRPEPASVPPEAQEELRESERKYALLFDRSAVPAAFLKLPEVVIVDANQALERLTGFTKQEMLGKTAVELGITRPEARTHAISEFQKHGSLLGSVVPVFTRAGEERTVYVNTNRLELRGKPYAVTTLMDITEQIRAEADRERLSSFNQLLLTSAGEGIYGVDLEGRITFVNPAAARLFGQSVTELIGVRAHDNHHHTKADGSPYPREDCPIYAAFHDGLTHFGKEELFWRPDGSSFPVEYTSTPIRDQDGRLLGAVVVFRDITEREEAEAEIRRLNSDLERRVTERTAQLQEANEELEAFSYSVSHDLRAPLRHVQGYAQMLAGELGDQISDKARSHLHTINDASGKMSQLIDDLLAFSRMGRAPMKEMVVDLNRLVQDVLRGLELATHDRPIQWTISTLPAVTGDPAMLTQVYANLLGNAVKYTRPRNPAEIQIGCAGHEDGRVVLFVRDNGVGFDPQYGGKLFGVFQRLHRADEFEGTGIGLANVRRVVARHGGRTWADGKLGEGATFYFTLTPSLPSEPSASPDPV